MALTTPWTLISNQASLPIFDWWVVKINIFAGECIKNIKLKKKKQNITTSLCRHLGDLSLSYLDYIDWIVQNFNRWADKLNCNSTIFYLTIMKKFLCYYPVIRIYCLTKLMSFPGGWRSVIPGSATQWVFLILILETWHVHDLWHKCPLL